MHAVIDMQRKVIEINFAELKLEPTIAPPQN